MVMACCVVVRVVVFIALQTRLGETRLGKVGLDQSRDEGRTDQTRPGQPRLDAVAEKTRLRCGLD
eukprot:9032662-Lingulodinium_polyedra.AAC.1